MDDTSKQFDTLALFLRDFFSNKSEAFDDAISQALKFLNKNKEQELDIRRAFRHCLRKRWAEGAILELVSQNAVRMTNEDEAFEFLWKIYDDCCLEDVFDPDSSSE